MFISYLQILIPFIGLVIDASVQMLSFKTVARLGLLKSEYVGFVAGLFSIFLIEFYIISTTLIPLIDVIALLIANLITYSSLGYCYFSFVNLGETARRIRILRELYDSKEGLCMKEILERYNSKEIVGKRINRLVNNGQIVYKDGRYYIGSPVMLSIARIIVIMKLIILGKRSEFG